MNVEDVYINRFKNYVRKHVNIVTFLGREVFDRDLSDHDLDKQEASGRDLDLYAIRNQKFNEPDFKINETDEEDIRRLVRRHVKINSHHPEYWDDSITLTDDLDNAKPIVHAENMSKEALEEMCCDWAAVALKKNQEMSKWYNSVIDKRFFFSSKQKDFIKECLSKLNDYIIDNDISFPGFGKYSPSKKSKFKEKIVKSAAVTFGRMNPMTTGHMKLCKKLHETQADEKFIYLSHTQDKPNYKNPLRCKNPLPYDVKYLYVDAFVKDSPYTDVVVKKSQARTIIDVACELYQKGFTDITFVVGEDRVVDFNDRISKYNGAVSKTTGKTLFNFNSINVISAGNRTTDSANSNDLEAMSASKQRQLAVEGNFEEFRKGVPTSVDDFAKDLYEDVRDYMGVSIIE